MIEHIHSGNCWKVAYDCKDCGEGNLCDVCHVHDEPRGECSECEICIPCEQEE